MSPQQRSDPSVSCELAAFDLKSSLLLWRRRLDTKGLLNIGGLGATAGLPLACAVAASRHACLDSQPTCSRVPELTLPLCSCPTCLSSTAVAAPHLQVESTTYSANTRPLVSYRDKPSYLAAFEAAQQWAAQQEREAQGAQQQLVAQQQAEQAAQAGREAAGGTGEAQQQQQEGAAAAANAAAAAAANQQQQQQQQGAAQAKLR